MRLDKSFYDGKAKASIATAAMRIAGTRRIGPIKPVEKSLEVLCRNILGRIFEAHFSAARVRIVERYASAHGYDIIGMRIGTGGRAIRVLNEIGESIVEYLVKPFGSALTGTDAPCVLMSSVIPRSINACRCAAAADLTAVSRSTGSNSKRSSTDSATASADRSSTSAFRRSASA